MSADAGAGKLEKAAQKPRRRLFHYGVVCGIALVFAARFVINETTIADRIVTPLLLPDTDAKAEAIIALGAGVTANCVPNQNAVHRVLRAARLWREGKAPVIVFTGGAPENSCPVSEAMAALARDVGVPASSILIEPTSKNTRENAEYTARLLRGLGIRRVLLVTDRLHMRRAQGAFVHAGLDVGRSAVPIYEGHPDNVSMLYSGLREFAGLAYYRMRGWTGAPAAPAETAGMTGMTATGATVGTRGMTGSMVANPDGPVVLLGASYAGGWKVATLGGVPVVNKGISGQQSFEVLARFETDVVAARPRAVILWGFINDLTRSDPAQVDQVKARTRDSYTQMIALARKHGIEPILATEMTLTLPDSWKETIGSWVGWALGKESFQDRINKHVIATNEWIVETAKREGLLLLDVRGALTDDRGLRRPGFSQPDGGHISDAGYAALTAYAEPILQKHFVNRQENR